MGSKLLFQTRDQPGNSHVTRKLYHSTVICALNMPLFNLRSIIEILIPGDAGSTVADCLLFQVRIGPWYCFTFLFFAFICVMGIMLMYKNFKLFCCIVGIFVFMNIWTQINSKFHFNPLPHTVPVDQAPDAASRTSDMTADGKYIWTDDVDRLDGDRSNFTITWQFHAVPGSVTQEEVMSDLARSKGPWNAEYTSQPRECVASAPASWDASQ